MHIAFPFAADYAYNALHLRELTKMKQSSMSYIFRHLSPSRNIGLQLRELKISAIVLSAFFLTIALFLTSCSQINSTAVPFEPDPQSTAFVEPTTAAPSSQATEPVPTAVPSTAVPPTSTPSSVAGEGTSSDLSLTAEDVQLFPVSTIISGDRVTFQVQPTVPEEVAVENVEVDIYVDGQLVSSDRLGSRNWEGKAQGFYEWVWDTYNLVDLHEVRVVLDSQDLIQEGDEDATNNETRFSVRIGKLIERPLEERDARWIVAENDCCFVHALTRSAAYRDLPELLTLLDSAVSEAANRIDEFPEDKIDVYFIERTIGQGGYAGSDMVVVYNDRPYIGGELKEIIVHEAIHIIDRQFAPQRISFLAEGVAVWGAGGHYKAQDLQLRAAALLAINEYIPLAELANDYYPSQHEISYLESGAFVDYLINKYGWPEFREFYSNTSISDGITEAKALDANLQRYFDISLAEAEATWLAELAELSPSTAEIDDLRTTIRYYDTARLYQTVLDPTAYFRTAWLPHPEDVVQFGNTADFSRQLDMEANFTSELILRSAYEAMKKQDYERANVLLESLERYLAHEGTNPDPLVTNFQNLVHTVVAFGYEPHKVTFDSDSAEILATTASGNRLFNLDLALRSGDWILLSN